MGDFHHTDHVHGFIQGEYECYIKGNICPGGIDTAPEGTAACKTRMALRTTGLQQHLAGLAQTMPNCAQPSLPALCPCRADGSFPMRRRQWLQLRRVLQPSGCR